MSFSIYLTKNIKKLSSPLKEEADLIGILKRRLTKKEFYSIRSEIENIEKKEVLTKLNIDDKKYEELKTKAIKKINFDGLKNELLKPS